MKITIHGVGYVGLVTGVCLAEAGYRVMCYDINQERIETLNEGYCPIFEPGLESLLEKNIDAGRIAFTHDPQMAVEFGMYQFIAVSTPAQDDGSAELAYVLSVADNIARYMIDYKLVITKSTVPVGTSAVVRDLMKQRLQALDKELDFDVASNPEFLKEGAAIYDFMKPDRIVLGVDSQRAHNYLHDLYAPFVDDEAQIMLMDVKSAELAKYASNGMLATRISFMNEIAQLCEVLEADVDDVRCVMGMDPRIGPLFLRPGPGYGGSCFPKDMKALIHMAMQHRVQTPLLQAVEHVNYRQKHRLFDKISRYFTELKGRTVAVWGLSFKPGTDDVRESSAAVLINALTDAGALVKAYDPVASNAYVKTYGQPDGLHIVTTAKEAIRQADCLVIVTEWPEFEQADYGHIKTELKSPVIFDGRNIFDPVLMASLGFHYVGMGRGDQQGALSVSPHMTFEKDLS